MYKILNQSDITEILLYSLIEGGYTASRVIEALRGVPQTQPITVRINSDGGDVFEAITLYNYLKDYNVRVIIDGICSSAATIIAMAGKTITMKQGSMFMIHKPLTYAVGNADDLKAIAETLEKITANIISIYQTRCKLSTEELLELMKAETWLDGAMAEEYGFIDEYESVSINDALTARYDDGVKAERERLKALDDLYAPGRAAIINRAKYSTFQSAHDVAIELLKAETAHSRTINGITLPVSAREQETVNAFTDTIVRKRGL